MTYAVAAMAVVMVFESWCLWRVLGRLGVVGRVDDAAEGGVRELGVDRHEAAADGDRRIDDLAVLEAMLKREVSGGEHVFEQALQEHLAELAARLGRSQHLLQTGDVAADLEHLARRRRKLA